MCFSLFEFGVPLEDIFPPGKIHPKLAELFIETYQAIVNSPHNLLDILRYLEDPTTLNDGLTYKENFLQCSPNSSQTSASTLLWVLRHFFGLLPLPLLPPYTAGKKFDWGQVAGEARLYFKIRSKLGATTIVNKDELDYKIARMLNHLPKENFLCLHHFISFIQLASKKLQNTHYKEYLYYFAKYFYTSIFNRPYTPGFKRNEDKIYFPLLFYIIVNWSIIKENCWKTEDNRKTQTSSTFLETNCRSISTQTHLESQQHLPIMSTTIFCQTDEFDSNINNQEVQINNFGEEIISRETLSDIIPDDELHYQIYKEPTLYPAPSEEDTSPYMDLRETDTLFVNKNNSNMKEKWSDICEETIKTVQRIERSCFDDVEKSEKRGKKVRNKISASEIVSLVNDEQNDSKNKTIEDVPKEILTSNKTPVGDYNKTKNSSSGLFEKVSKIGWTYTPPNVAEKKGNKFQSNSYHSYEKALEEDQIQESIIPEVKHSNTSLNSQIKKTADTHRKKVLNFKKIRKTFGFLKTFSSSKLSKSPNCDAVRSSVRYKRMQNKKCIF